MKKTTAYCDLCLPVHNEADHALALGHRSVDLCESCSSEPMVVRLREMEKEAKAEADARADRALLASRNGLGRQMQAGMPNGLAGTGGS